VHCAGGQVVAGRGAERGGMIRIEEGGGLRRVVIDRKGKANSLTAAMLAEMAAAVEGSTAAALVLTGSGTVFSAGADLDEVRTGTLATDPGWERLSAAVAAHGGLTVAALNGTAAGGALGMVLAADLRFAVPAATLFYPVLKMGVLPQPSDPGRLARLAGPSRARMMLLAGARVTAAEALQWGLLDRVVEAEELEAAVQAAVAPALAAGPGRVAEIRALIDRGRA
jgi:enoyl-CoA hydratase/carnithine racemase